ncbi:hypothetical protein TBK1r_66520 [Stieleria magnilauensis]|uniref:Uncharacterized protein n=1 Tax=Stieleria magnilauensis TaxID=2527963 RepID=A0ABX5Y266_9BACT|nr:hypothetical protein TBK1r_66520 [Planctomycetes bacterium TBK1r]
MQHHGPSTSEIPTTASDSIQNPLRTRCRDRGRKRILVVRCHDDRARRKVSSIHRGVTGCVSLSRGTAVVTASARWTGTQNKLDSPTAVHHLVHASGHDDSLNHHRWGPMYSIGIADGNSRCLAQTCFRWTGTMKPGGLAQCLPVVSATGIQGNEVQRPEGPTQLFS